MRLGSDQDVAAILGISHDRLKARISAGAPVPPFMRAPGSKYRRWDLDAVAAWLVQYTVRGTADQGLPRRGRGRPRKAKK
jgi:hypothetical protein